MIDSCTIQKHQVRGYRWSGLLSQTAFCQSCKTALMHYRACRANGNSNQNWWGVRLPMFILTYPVDCVHLCHLLRIQHHSLCINGKELAFGLPTHPPTHPLIHDTRDITGIIKTISKTSSEYCVAELAMKQ